MLKSLRIIAALAATLVFAGRMAAENPKPAEGAKAPEAAQPAEGTPQISPEKEREQKLRDIKKEFDVKLTISRQRLQSILSDDQKKAAIEACTAAVKAGKTREESFKAAEAAVKLTPDQKVKWDKIIKEIKALEEDARARIMELYTPEQYKAAKEQMLKKLAEAAEKPDAKKDAKANGKKGDTKDEKKEVKKDEKKDEKKDAKAEEKKDEKKDEGKHS
jgi:hypothetical protein